MRHKLFSKWFAFSITVAISCVATLSTGMLSGCSTEETEVISFKASISMSRDQADPPVNDSIQTITLDFSKEIDSKTLSGAIKLYRIDSDGKAAEETCSVKIDDNNPRRILINNQKVSSFTGGEEYKIEITTALQSSAGLSLKSNFTGYFATNYTFALTGIPSMNGVRSSILVISDIHLGVDDKYAEINKNRPALISFLNQIKTSPNIKELVIAGDFLDEWFLPMNYEMPDSQADFFDSIAANNQGVVDAFNAIIKEGNIKVTYIPGNHDLLATEADIERIFPGINQARDSAQGLGTYIAGNHSEIAIEHGHRYNFFCAPDPISNRTITNSNSSITPPGYFFTRIATSSIIEGRPKSANIFPEMTANKENASQYNYYLYYQAWKAILTTLPVNEGLSDKVIKTNIDGYKTDYSINDFLPSQNASGVIDVNLYKGIQDSWDQRQTINGVTVKIPIKDAILGAASPAATDEQAKKQYFNVDAAKKIVVFGHSHVARVMAMTNLNDQKTIYANTGTWIDGVKGNPVMTFVVITPAKSGSPVETVNLYQYSADKTITQWCEAQAITD